MATRKVEVAVAHGPFETEVVRGLLASYGIAADFDSAMPHSVLPCLYDEAGRVGVWVDESDAEAAAELLARHRRSGLVIVRDEFDDGFGAPD